MLFYGAPSPSSSFFSPSIRSKRTERSQSLLGSLSQSFLALSAGEQHGTYLKTASKALGDIIGDIEHKGDDIYDESVFAEDLESIKDFVGCALALLKRVEGYAINSSTITYQEQSSIVYFSLKFLCYYHIFQILQHMLSKFHFDIDRVEGDEVCLTRVGQ